MLGNTRLFKPLAKAADGNAGRLPDRTIIVIQTSLNEGPDLIHERCHELAATLNGDTESKHSTSAMRGLSGTEVFEDEGAERREDLVRGKVGCKTVNDAESRLEKESQWVSLNEVVINILEKEHHRRCPQARLQW